MNEVAAGFDWAFNLVTEPNPDRGNLSDRNFFYHGIYSEVSGFNRSILGAKHRKFCKLTVTTVSCSSPFPYHARQQQRRSVLRLRLQRDPAIPEVRRYFELFQTETG